MGLRRKLRRRNKKIGSEHRRLLLTWGVLAVGLVSYNVGKSQQIAVPFTLSPDDAILPTQVSVETTAFYNTSIGNTKAQNPISCSEIFARRQAGEWEDPNAGIVHSVKVEEDIPFFVSVHNESYDPLRWNTVYKQKKYYEREVVHRYNHILSSYEKPSILIDVGANIGYYSLLGLSRGCSSVIAFEVNPPNLFRICESLQLNEWDKQDRLELHLRGVSVEHGATMWVNVDIENPGRTGIKRMRNGGSSSTNKLTTETVSLDGFFTERGWFSEEKADLVVSILKVDIEGKEAEVFLAAEQLLRSGIVHNVLTEFRRFRRKAASDALSILVNADYRLVNETTKRKLSRDETVQKIEQYRNAPQTQNTFDLWFQKESII